MSSDSDDQAKRSKTHHDRKKCAGDWSHKCPRGASFRKYTPTGKSPYWCAVLPEGAEDDKGRHKHQSVWTDRSGNGTEEQVRDGLLDWVWKWHDNIIYEPPSPSLPGDGPSDSDGPGGGPDDKPGPVLGDGLDDDPGYSPCSPDHDDEPGDGPGDGPGGGPGADDKAS